MASVSSRRQLKGLSNSLYAFGSKGLRDHNESPGALQGMAQVIACFDWSGAKGIKLPIQISSAMTAPVSRKVLSWIATARPCASLIPNRIDRKVDARKVA